MDEAEGPLYVVAIDADHHRVIVGPQSALACHEVRLSEASWVSRGGAPTAGFGATAGSGQMFESLEDSQMMTGGRGTLS